MLNGIYKETNEEFSDFVRKNKVAILAGIIGTSVGGALFFTGLGCVLSDLDEYEPFMYVGLAIFDFQTRNRTRTRKKLAHGVRIVNIHIKVMFLFRPFRLPSSDRSSDTDTKKNLQMA